MTFRGASSYKLSPQVSPGPQPAAPVGDHVVATGVDGKTKWFNPLAIGKYMSKNYMNDPEVTVIDNKKVMKLFKLSGFIGPESVVVGYGSLVRDVEGTFHFTPMTNA